MNKLTENFLGILEAETDLHRSLLSVIRREKEALLDSQLEQLNEAGKEKENLLLKIRIVEEQRIHLSKRLAMLVGCQDHNLTLKELLQKVGPPYSERLKACRSELLTLIRDIQAANSSNRMILVHSLDMIKGSLSLLESLMASNHVYYPSGRLQGGECSGKMFAGRI